MARKNRSSSAACVRAITDRDKAWQSMRILRWFNIPDLVATAGINESNADQYVRGLTGAGYLRIVHLKDNGRKGGHAVYQLLRNTGPSAPRLRTDGWVYDINTSEIHQGRGTSWRG